MPPHHLSLRYLAVFALLLAAPPALPQTQSLSTDVSSNGGCEGAFFDISVLGGRDLTITGFETNQAGEAEVEVYFKEGTGVGFETDASAWTLLGSDRVSGGSGFIQTLYPLNVGGLQIPAGETFGLLVYSGTEGGTGALATRYATSQVATVSDDHLSITTGAASCGGTGIGAPFDGINSERAWRGTVLYALNYQVGGTVTGLVDGTVLVLQNNAGGDLVINDNGPFTFSDPVFETNNYSVTVLSQPRDPTQMCTVENGEGTIAGADVNDVTITCAIVPYQSIPTLSRTGLLVLGVLMFGALFFRQGRRAR